LVRSVPRGHTQEKIEQERQGQDGAEADRGARQAVGEVVPAQADDRGRHDSRDRAGHDHERQAHHPRPGPLGRDEEQDGERRRQRDGGPRVAAGKGDLTEIGPVEQVLQQRVVQGRGDRDRGHREHRAVQPPGDQAAGRDDDADHDGRDDRPGRRQPQQERFVAGEEPGHRRVDGVVERIRPRLPVKQQAERDDDGHAGRQR
jgi:hypothetical protein